MDESDDVNQNKPMVMNFLRDRIDCNNRELDTLRDQMIAAEDAAALET